MTLEAVPPAPPIPQLSEEFTNQVAGIKALEVIHDLLQKGLFPYAYRNAIEGSLAFIDSLHKQSTEAALIHPEVDKVPQLVALKEARAKAELDKKTVEKAKAKRTRKATARKK